MFFMLSVKGQDSLGMPTSTEVGIVVSESAKSVLKNLGLFETSEMAMSNEFRREDFIIFCESVKGEKFKLESFPEVIRLPLHNQ